MRPHHLTLTAFGPFAGTVEVDLDALAAGGLFLLHGQTGAGKTTLLDGLCFALFGRVPGTRGERRLRSDHAGPEAVCAVTAELTVGGRRLRITRSPAYERAKKRGAGTVTVHPTVRVEELRRGEWTTWSVQPGEADLEIRDLVGMSAEQFWRVVLLPQGGFAAFLHAKAAERGELLERLFGTDRFAAVEGWLADRRREGERDLTDAGSALAGLVGRVAQEAGLEMPDDADFAWYEGVLTAANAALLLADAEAVAVTAAADGAAASHRSAERLAALQRRRSAAAEAWEVLRASADIADDARRRAAAARRAAPLLPLVDRAEGSAAAALAAAAPAVDPAAVPAAVAELARLEALTSQAKRVALQRARALDATVAHDAATAGRLAVATEQHALPPALAAAVAWVDDAMAATTQRPAARAEADLLAALGADAERADHLIQLLAAAREVETTAREHRVAAQEVHLALRSALLGGQAARLALELVDGEACAVCGGTEHPAPAFGGAAIPTEAALTEAEAATADWAAARAEAGERVATLARELAEVTGRLATAGWADPSGLAATSTAAVARSLDIDARAADLAAASTEVRSLHERSAALDTRDARLAATQSAAAESRDEAHAAVRREAAMLTDELGGAVDLDTALDRARTQLVACEQAAAAGAESARRTEIASAAAAQLAAALTDAGYADPVAVRADALPVAVLTELDLQVAEHAGAVLAARSTLDDAELADLPAAPVDVAAAGAEAARCANVRDEAVRLAGIAADRRRAVAALGPGLSDRLTALAPLRARHAEVAHLAALARGQNLRGMSLSSYVLAARLEQVAVAASSRLGAMSDGRYALRHTDVRVDGRSRSGLDLEVVDAWTGARRDTRTLSGGETFVASLALALGLADVVAAEAGGAPIEALFVDEGFGSLDPETLEEVMDHLDGLRSGGRVVGVVSHVADLRRRIPAQLHVRKGRAGSTLEVAGPLGA